MQETWDLSPLFKSDDDLAMKKARKEIEEKHKVFVGKWKQRSDYLQDPLIMKQALDEYENLMRFYGTSGAEGYYFSLREYLDQANPLIKARVNNVDAWSKAIQNEIHFFTLRIAKIPHVEQQKFLKHPQLKKYEHFLERMFTEAEHVLSEPEENLLNLLTTTSYDNWVKMVSTFFSKESRIIFDEEGKENSHTFEALQGLLESSHEPVRSSAARAMNDILNKHSDVVESEMNSILAYKKTVDQIRKFSRPDSSRHLSDDVSSEMVDTLVASVSASFHLSERFYALKAKILGLSKLQYYERNLSYGTLNQKYSYEESVNLVRKVLHRLDTEFGAIFEQFLKEGSIDVYPREGKHGGAYCIHNLMSHPTYIMLNHVGRLQDVKTLAHEVGHGINNELMKKQQHALSFDTPKSTAEVASTFMEDFVFEELERGSNPEQRLALLIFKLNQDVSTVFRQIAFYNFEQELHIEYRNKGYLAKEIIHALFLRHMKAYMGDAVDFSGGGDAWWEYIPHFRDFFYVFSYASGLLISKSLQAKVRKDPSFIIKVKEFLSAGTSDSPRNIFLKMGIDITDKEFWNQGLKEFERLIDETTALAKKLGKIK